MCVPPSCASSMRFTVPVVAVMMLFMSLSEPRATAADDQLTDQQVTEIATDAYLYAYPLILMDLTRKVSTNCERPDLKSMRAPINQFVHLKTFPDATFTNVVRPNADTLYSAIWFDVTEEPLLIHVQSSRGRYFLLPMLDMWSDVFASPGKRTTGTGEQAFAIVGPKWHGKLPKDVRMIRSPTGTGWMIGRTQANGKDDFSNVHKFQAGLIAVPLSAWTKAKDYTPPIGKVDPKISSDPPVVQVAKMDAAAFFTRFTELTKNNPPHANDYPILARMNRIGLEPGKRFDFDQAPKNVQTALTKAIPIGRKMIEGGLAKAGTIVNNWTMMTPPIGTYGTDYLRRAQIAYGGLGANVIEDAIYPTAFVDADGTLFNSNKKYIVRFTEDQIPPVRAFWSLSMYNDRQSFAANPINRYAIGDRDKLKFDADGSLTLFIQRESPGKDKESNWLPAPKSGGFSMNLRLYWPKRAALDGSWKPAAVECAK